MSVLTWLMENGSPQVGTAFSRRLLDYMAWLEERDRGSYGASHHILEALQTARADLEQCSELVGANDEAQRLLDRTLDRLNSASRDLRRARSPIQSETVDGRHLADGLRSLGRAALRSSMLTVEVRVNPAIDGLLPASQGALVLWIVREAVTNVLRHAHAERLAIRGVVQNRRLVLSVSDDGCGFDSNKSADQERIGLIKMRDWADWLKGMLQIESACGVGTIITLTIPLDTRISP